jgi:DNA repair exonuclease SbcCD nuclease subunit
MAFKALHTSDWHVGRPFGQLDPGLAGVLRHARLTAIDRLAAAARRGQARHVLVGGDLYDRPSLADRDVGAPLGQMGAHADLVWHVIPGNHDPADGGGIWERACRLGLPANVVLHLAREPREIAPGVWLLPAPLAGKATSVDPTQWMDQASTPPDAIRIGLAHGSIHSFGGEHRASIEIAPDRARKAGLAYLALGDWHGTLEIGPRTAYSGTPEPDGFLDNESGLALLVSIEGAEALPVITRAEIGEYRWISRTSSTARATDIAGVEEEIDGLGALARRVLLKVEVTGRVTIAQDREIRARLDRLEARVLHLERRLDRLVAAPAVDDIARFADPGLRELAQDLTRLAETEEDDQRQVAQRAMRHLFELADRIAAAGDGVRA